MASAFSQDRLAHRNHAIGGRQREDGVAKLAMFVFPKLQEILSEFIWISDCI